MRAATRDLWEQQDRHPGDRLRLFTAVGEAIDVTTVLYPGSYVDVAPSFVWPNVVYVDTDRRAARFFGDEAGVREIVALHRLPAGAPSIAFVQGDYTTDLSLPLDTYELLISLYAGPVSEHCTRYLRVGGWLLVNPSHGDAALASLDERYVLDAVVHAHAGAYRVSRSGLEGYLVPKGAVTAESIRATGRGVAYTRHAFAYLFRRVG